MLGLEVLLPASTTPRSVAAISGNEFPGFPSLHTESSEVRSLNSDTSPCVRSHACHAAPVSSAARASFVLVICCFFWAFSFPLLKALVEVGHQAVPEASTVFLSSLCTTLRFAVGALVLAVIQFRSLSRITGAEWRQGAGIGFLGGFGLVLQMDGMAYTLASTSAFLTQGYVVLIPLWMVLKSGRMPAGSVAVTSVLSVIGAGWLGWEGGLGGGLHFGRGEWETLAGSALFAGQILWLERPEFRSNNSLHATLIMFAVMALVTGILAFGTSPGPGAWIQVYRTRESIVLLAVLVVLCTMTTYPFANHWQPKVSATQAGLLYCSEPVFTSWAALFVPGLISRFAGIPYPNELLTWNLLGGGGLILIANVWLQLRPPPPAVGSPASGG